MLVKGGDDIAQQKPMQISEIIQKLREKMIKVPPTRSYNTPAEDRSFNLGIGEAISLLEQLEGLEIALEATSDEIEILARIDENEWKMNVPIMPGDDDYACGYNDHAQEMEHLKSKRIADLQSKMKKGGVNDVR